MQENLSGQKLGNCYLKALVGRGSFSEVYAAIDTVSCRPVACKVLRKCTAQVKGEAKALLALKGHPHIVDIYSVGYDNGHHFIEMELCKGSLADRLKENRLNCDEAAGIALQVLSGLGYAHDMQILHRDIKPENILFAGDGRVKLCDFGLYKHVKQRMKSSRATWVNPNLHSHGFRNSAESSAAVAGTLAYMAPEQMLGVSDERSDLFSVGTLLYRMIAGDEPLYTYESVGSRRLDDIIIKSRSKNPKSRFQSAEEMQFELRRAVGSAVVDLSFEWDSFYSGKKQPVKKFFSSWIKDHRDFFAYLVGVPAFAASFYFSCKGLAVAPFETLASAGIASFFGASGLAGKSFIKKGSVDNTAVSALKGAFAGTFLGGGAYGSCPQDFLWNFDDYAAVFGCSAAGLAAGLLLMLGFGFCLPKKH